MSSSTISSIDGSPLFPGPRGPPVIPGSKTEIEIRMFEQIETLIRTCREYQAHGYPVPEDGHLLPLIDRIVVHLPTNLDELSTCGAAILSNLQESQNTDAEVTVFASTQPSGESTTHEVSGETLPTEATNQVNSVQFPSSSDAGNSGRDASFVPPHRPRPRSTRGASKPTTPVKPPTESVTPVQPAVKCAAPAESPAEPATRAQSSGQSVATTASTSAVGTGKKPKGKPLKRQGAFYERSHPDIAWLGDWDATPTIGDPFPTPTQQMEIDAADNELHNVIGEIINPRTKKGVLLEGAIRKSHVQARVGESRRLAAIFRAAIGPTIPTRTYAARGSVTGDSPSTSTTPTSSQGRAPTSGSTSNVTPPAFQIQPDPTQPPSPATPAPTSNAVGSPQTRRVATFPRLARASSHSVPIPPASPRSPASSTSSSPRSPHPLSEPPIVADASGTDNAASVATSFASTPSTHSASAEEVKGKKRSRDDVEEEERDSGIPSTPDPAEVRPARRVKRETSFFIDSNGFGRVVSVPTVANGSTSLDEEGDSEMSSEEGVANQTQALKELERRSANLARSLRKTARAIKKARSV